MKIHLHLLLSLFSFISFAQTNSGLPDDVVMSIEKRIEYRINPSVAVGIVDEIGSHFYNFGTKTIDGESVDNHTIYEIGSITKVFTAILLAKQVEDGKVKLDDPIAKYLPSDVVVPERGGMVITLAHLSDHTSSLPRLPGNMNPSDISNPYADYSVEQLYKFISSHELTRDIGSAYEYSNLAQGLLGHILSLNSGISYEDLMIKEIAKPLKMKETKITFSSKMKSNLATGYNQGVKASNWDLPTLAGAGAIRSSTFDMIKFLKANLGLSKSSLKSSMKMTHEKRHSKAGRASVGLGWHIHPGEKGDIIWHNGGTGGYRAFAGFVHELNKGVVLLTNSTESVDDIGFYLLGSPDPMREIKPNISTELRKLIESEGIEAATERYNKIKAENPDEYNFNEMSINTLGNNYLEKDVKTALAIFKLNVDEFPSSFNVYNSYGEALLKNGQTDLAIESYKKSVEINPGNMGGIEALKKLGVELEENEIVLSENLLETYLGRYEIQPTFSIEITREGTDLFGQATGQQRFQLFPKNETEFYLKVVAAQITFNVSENQDVESLTLFQNGMEIVGKKK